LKHILNNLPEAKDKHIEKKVFRVEKKTKNLDYVMQDLHDEFKKTDCLKCANCCKTTGHYLRMQILSVSKYLRQNHNSLLSNIFKSMKTEIMCCKASRVLFDENACMIYDVRPKKHENFHIRIEKFQQITDLTLKM
jgi:hypothetical protein